MKRFDITATPKAQSDVDKLRFAIIFKFRAPLTAKRYVEGLNKKVQSLKVGADAIQIDKAFSAQYGMTLGASTTKRWQSSIRLKEMK